MAIVGIRELSRDTSRVIKRFEETGEPVIVTREGRPIGALVSIDQRQVEDLILATAPELSGGDRAQEDGEEHSATEVARAIGAQVPPGDDPSQVRSRTYFALVEDVVSEELSPPETVFAPTIMPHVHQAATQIVAEE